MDLESESSVLQPVEDYGFIGEVETNVDKLVSTVEAGRDEPSTSPPVETSPPTSKGLGLRKWRRRVRRDLVKDDTCVSMENSRVLKRVLSGAADPNAKQMHFPGHDVGQESLGSVNNIAGFAIDGSSHGAGLAFSAGMDSDNSEDRSSKSSAVASGSKVRCERTVGHSLGKQRAKYLGGKSVVSWGDSGQQRKSSVENRERIKIEKENSHSSMESADSRSSNFVFMQGASFTLSSREPGGRRMMDYNEENSDQEAHTSTESVEESEIKNNGSSDNTDPLSAAFKSFQDLQEALEKELQKFQELGKEPISRAGSSSCIHTGHDRDGEATSSRWFGSENMGEKRLTSLDSEIRNLVNNVEHLEVKLEETKRILEVKESQIRDLESTINVSEPHNRATEVEVGIGIEDIFRQKMEAEIEYLIFSGSVENLKRKIKLIEKEKTLAENEAHKTLSKLEEAEGKAENLKNQAQDLQNHCTKIQEGKGFKKSVFKTTSCLLLQLGLLFMLFNFQLMPESDTVVPT